MKIVALIPARGGSKGVPRKNMRPLAGKPLLAWTIDAALRSSAFEKVIVSTDDSEIAEVARRYGADAPFVRPSELATDEARSVDVLLHAMEWLSNHGGVEASAVMMLQPTSPLRAPEDIRAAIALQRKHRATAVVSVCESGHPPQWLRRIDENGELQNLQNGAEISRRQDVAEPVYQLNGAIYLIERSVLFEEKSVFPRHTRAYVMPRERSLDIDSLWDFQLAEWILTNGMVHAASRD